MNQLQQSLLANALFSGVSGTLLLVFHAQLADLFSLENSTAFWIIGIALLYFTATIVYEIKMQGPRAVLWIIAQDFLWVIASLVLLVWNPFLISFAGNLIIALVALGVLLMAINQSVALAKVDNSPDTPEMKQIQFERVFSMDKQATWEVIADVANYHQVAPNIDDVKIISGHGAGMVRACSHGKDSWTETCTLWEDEKRYAFEVNTAAPDYPYLFKYLHGYWEVEEVEPATTKVVLRFRFQYKSRLQNLLIHPFLKGKFTTIVEELLGNWEKLVL